MIKHPITKPTKHLDVHRSSAIFSKQSKHQNTWCFSVSGTVVSVLMLFMVAMTPAFWYSPTRFSKKLVFPCRLIISIQSNGFEPGTRGVFVEYGDQCPGLRMKKQLDVHLPKNAIYMYRNMHFYSLLLYIYTWIKAWAKQKPLPGQFQHWETVKDLGMVQGNQEPIRHKFDVLRHQYLGTRDDFAGNWWDMWWSKIRKTLQRILFDFLVYGSSKFPGTECWKPFQWKSNWVLITVHYSTFEFVVLISGPICQVSSKSCRHRPCFN